MGNYCCLQPGDQTGRKSNDPPKSELVNGGRAQPNPYPSNPNPSTNPSLQPPPLPPPPPPTPPIVRVRALFTYRQQHNDDISFEKGETMELVDNETSEDWWLVRLADGREGYVPSTYVRIHDDSPQAHDCWFDIPRRDAERMLLWPGRKRGTYIARPCGADPSCLSMSIRDYDDRKDVPVVKHYKIRRMDAGRGFYISPTSTFPSFSSLIQYYTESTQTGLCTPLTEPCPRAYTPPPHFKDFEINRNAIIMVKKLGSGAFGDVWQAKMSGVFDVAVKCLKDQSSTSETATEQFIEEARNMHKLMHAKIVRLLGVCTKSTPIYIITELMSNGALYDYLPKKGPRELPFAVLVDMIAQIAEGMAYLESMQFIHRDLRAANILVGEQNEVKVADFGLSRNTQVYEPSEDAKFPVRWTAPEAIYHKQFTTKSDVWSFGILIYEIVTYSRQPYAGMSNKEIIEKINGSYRLESPDGSPLGAGVTDSEGAKVVCPEALYKIMLQCWNGNPERRATFEYLHKTFDDFQTSAQGDGYVDNAMAVPTSPAPSTANGAPPSFESALRTGRK